LRTAPSTVTNYDLFTQALRADSVVFLDLIPPFARSKTTKPYRLFPRDSIYWSGYGAMLAAYTLLRQPEQLGQGNPHGIPPGQAKKMYRNEGHGNGRGHGKH
jgi:hypothetical protein